MKCNGICAVCKNKKVEVNKPIEKQTEIKKEIAVIENEHYIVQKRIGKLIARKEK